MRVLEARKPSGRSDGSGVRRRTGDSVSRYGHDVQPDSVGRRIPVFDWLRR